MSCQGETSLLGARRTQKRPGSPAQRAHVQQRPEDICDGACLHCFYSQEGALTDSTCTHPAAVRGVQTGYVSSGGQMLGPRVS